MCVRSAYMCSVYCRLVVIFMHSAVLFCCGWMTKTNIGVF